MTIQSASKKAILVVALLYVFNAVLYSVTLTYSMLYNKELNYWQEVLWQLKRMSIDGSVKAILTIPVWFLIFKVLLNKPLIFRVILHIPFAFIFAFGFRFIFYSISDAWAWPHLGGYGAVWDLYIPILFYFIQFGVFHAMEYHQQKLEEKNRNALLLQAKTKMELQALKAQLNPHFLYNVFNTINASIPKELESTREMIGELSDLFRFHLEASRKDRIKLKQELDFIRKYLNLEAARFGDRLKWDFDVDPELYDCQIPPLLMHPLVENAVKHGIGPCIKGGKLWVKIGRHKNRLLFEIGDNGAGVDIFKLGTSGTGLANTRERLFKGHNEKLEIESFPQKGFKARFGLNLFDEESTNN